MLQTISWIEFSWVVILITAGYYTIFGLLLYNGEIAQFCKRQVIGVFSRQDRNEPNQIDRLMGSAEPHASREQASRAVSVAADEFTVMPNHEDESGESITGERRLNHQQDLLEEVQTLLAVVSPDNVQEATSLFQALLERYDYLTDSVYRDQVSWIIHNGCKQRDLHFEWHEVRAWWPSH